jgi:hypothetical protein
VTETGPVKFPPVGLMVGVATVCRPTFKLNVVVFVTPPPEAVTVMVELPAGVEAVVLIVSVEEQLGLQEAEEKDPVAPEGKPDTDKETAWVPPETNVTTIELVTEEPATSDLSPELVREKLKGWVILNDALVSALGFDSLLKAFALITALLVNVIAPV